MEGHVAKAEPDFSRFELLSTIGDSVSIPLPLRHLSTAIAESRKMLDYEDDWDGEGSPGYEEATWRRAVGLLLRCASAAWHEERTRVEAPRITNGPMGSVDIHWALPQRELLVNVPADPEAAPDFYGDNRAGEFAIKGSLDLTRDNRWLAVWLAE